MKLEINGQTVDVLESWGKNFAEYLDELYERSSCGKTFYVPGFHYDSKDVYRCRLSWNSEDYSGIRTECENVLEYLNTIAVDVADWLEKNVPESKWKFDSPEVEETWITYFQAFDGEDKLSDDEDLLDHRADFEKEAGSRLGDSKFALDEIVEARVLEAVIRFNRKDPCEGGNKIACDMGCVLARAIILRKYCMEYELVYQEEKA